MNAFTVKGTIHNLEVGFIITPIDHLFGEFKVEMITDCPNPARVRKNGKKWSVIAYGCMPFTHADVKKLGREIQKSLLINHKQALPLSLQMTSPTAG